MMNAKRGRGSDRVVRIAAIAALGLALSACGGGTGNSSGTASAAQSSTPTGSSVPAQGQAPAQSTSTGSSTPAGSTGTGSTSTGSTGSGSTGTGSTGTGSTGSGSTGSGSTGSNPPTASASNITLNWSAPTENVDGTSLTDLAGFKIHYGTASKNYTQTITVNNPGLATYVVSNLSPGTYYFAVSAYSAAGVESPLSSEVSTTVN